jgi:hypothetical protein
LSVSNSILVTPKTHTLIILDRKFIKRLDNPYSKCLKNTKDFYPSEIYQLFLVNNLTYNERDCKEMLIQNYVNEKCNCSHSIYLDIFKRHICVSQFETNCQKNASFEYVDRIDPQDVIKKCPIECDYIEIDYKIQQTRYPSSRYLKYLRSNPRILPKFPNESKISDEEIMESIVSVGIRYEDLKYTEISQSASLDFIGLVSNIGGLLGLFLGLSLLSFVEIIELIIELLYYIIVSSNRIKNDVNQITELNI